MFCDGGTLCLGNPEEGSSVRLSGQRGLPGGGEAQVKHERGQELARKDLAGGHCTESAATARVQSGPACSGKNGEPVRLECVRLGVLAFDTTEDSKVIIDWGKTEV